MRDLKGVGLCLLGVWGVTIFGRPTGAVFRFVAGNLGLFFGSLDEMI
jgi:hypothetical protein